MNPRLRARPAPVPQPASQSLVTGFLGALVLAIGAVGLTLGNIEGLPSGNTSFALAILLFLAFLTMAIFEIGVVRIHQRHFDFERPRPACFRRILKRYFGLATTLLVAWLVYGTLLEYQLHIVRLFPFVCGPGPYQAFFGLFAVVTKVILVTALPYLYFCERFGTWNRDEDELLCVSDGYVCLLAGRCPSPVFFAVWRGYCVKMFFIPLMVTFLLSNVATFDRALGNAIRRGPGSLMDVYWVSAWYDVAYEGLYFIDTGIALIGYLCTLRLFDSHIRSAEPTVFGWLVALACYPPFGRMLDAYLGYNSAGGRQWGEILKNHPVAFLTMAVLITICSLVFCLSTLAFGLRFSNLTHRGILTRGPYAVVRHPAYTAKNLSWWLINLPFLSNLGDCLRLAGMNLVYLARAVTEERHLARDPVYVDYARRVRWRFIPWIL